MLKISLLLYWTLSGSYYNKWWQLQRFWWQDYVQTSADNAVRILSGITVRCLSVKILNFQSGRFSSVRISNLNLILTDRHRTVVPDRIRTALSADVWLCWWPCMVRECSDPYILWKYGPFLLDQEVDDSIEETILTRIAFRTFFVSKWFNFCWWRLRFPFWLNPWPQTGHFIQFKITLVSKLYEKSK